MIGGQAEVQLFATHISSNSQVNLRGRMYFIQQALLGTFKHFTALFGSFLDVNNKVLMSSFTSFTFLDQSAVHNSSKF